MPEWEITSEDPIEAAPGWEVVKETPILAARDLARSTTEVTGLAGTQVEPETFLGRVAEAWETGELQTELGILGYRQIIGEDLPEIETRIKEIEALLPTHPRKKRGIPERAVTFVAEQIPLMASGMRKGAQRGLTLGLGAAAITAVAGQVGPQAVLPEEIITVPSAFTAMYGVGMVSGTVENIAQIEAGLAYRELLALKDAKGNRLDPVITKSAAAGVGLINGLIELAQIKLLLKTIPGGEALLRGAIRKATIKAVRSKTLQGIALRAARRHAAFVTGETAQEVAQESTNILANETVKFFSNEIQKKTDIPYATRKEITDRLLTIAEESAIGFTLMGVPGQVATITGEVVRPEAPIPVKAELVEKGMPEEEKTEPTIIRQQKVAQKESQKQAFLTKIAQDVADPETPLTAAEVALMGQYVPEELEISQQELNRAAAKGIQTTVISDVTEEVAKAGEKILVPEPEIVEIEVPEPEIVEIEVPEPEIVEEEIPAEEIEVIEPEVKPVPTVKEIDTAAKEAEPKPTEAQIEADNYKKGHIKLYGFDITIETAKGTVRSGTDRQGKKWSITMQHHYGDILGTKGKDKDHLDVFIGPKPETDKVFVVDQTVPETGKFDEHKIMMGFEAEEEARAGYLANYEEGWKGLGTITEFTVDEFKTWTKEADTTKAIGEIKPAEKPKEVLKALTEEQIIEIQEGKRLPPPKPKEPTKPTQAELEAKLAASQKAAQARVKAEKGIPPETEVLPQELEGVPDFMELGKKRGLRPGVSQPATEWGVIATPEQVKALKAEIKLHEKRMAEFDKRAAKAKEAGDMDKFRRIISDKGEIATGQGQGLREALEAAEGKWPDQASITIRERAEAKAPKIVIKSFRPGVGKVAEIEVKEERPAPETKAGIALKERVERERAEREKPTAFKIGDYVTPVRDKDVLKPGRITHIQKDYDTGEQKLRLDGKGPHWNAADYELTEEEKPEKPLTKAEKERIVKTKEGEKRAEEKPGILREPGEEPLEGAAPEDVPGVEEERAPGKRPPARPGEDFGGYDESDIRARPEGTRGLGDGEGKIHPSPERGRPAELGRQHASGRNYRITDADALEEGGPVAKYDRNIGAIKLLKTIEGENRPATPEEQVTLAKYVGWGGLSEVFKRPWGRERTGWGKRYEELNKLLEEEEYESARKSTPNAHFTSPLIINHIYDALKWMGFDGGRIIEPSMGIGHFFGRVPGDWRTKLVGIEIDSISARIAKLLYPDADVRAQGYEETKLPNNFFDLALSNVPFGDYKVFDPDYAKLKFFIHDYFFAKSLDKVRPGGLVAFITSAGMMNKKDKRIRKYIAGRAELIAAIRLPNNAFKKIANTEVTTDIIFLRKLKEGEKPKGPAWLNSTKWEIPDEYGTFLVNEYFHKYPHMQLGKIVKDKLHWDRIGLESDGRDLGAALKEIVEKFIPRDLYEKIRHKATTDIKVADMVPAPEHIKNFAYFAKADQVYQKQVVEGITSTVVVKLDKAETGRMKGLVNLRDKIREVLHNQLANKEDLLEADLKAVNTLYDRFVTKYGFVHAKANLKRFEGDPDRPLLLSLENWDTDKKTATKTDIFRQRTMAKYVPVEKAETAQDALIASIFDRGRIDFNHMAKISGIPEHKIKEDLKGIIFLDPEKNAWQTAEEYLSGNVRTKLEAAKAAAEMDRKYAGNVNALKKAQPENKKPSQITARLGANWIPETDYKEFLGNLLGARGYTPRYIPTISAWVLEKGTTWETQVDDVLNEQKWGTPDVTGLDLITQALNLKLPTVYSTITVGGEQKKVINRTKTLLAQTKQQEIKEEFERWVWEDTDRRNKLAQIYNDKFNNIRLRKYDGQHLPNRLPGMAMGVDLRPHQKDNTWRIIQGKNTLLAQVVGSGKTLSMTAAAMELRRLGLAKKPLFVVPKHLLKSWEAEFLKFYPAAKILVPEEKGFTPQKRTEFMARISTGDWDAVIITHPNMLKLPVSKKVQNDFIRGQIEELEDAIEAEEPEGRKKSRTVKELEKMKRRLEEKLSKQLAGGEKDTGVTFEELGVDYMFIDESHNFKNLWFGTRMTRVPGIQPSDVDKTTDIFLKSRYLTKLNNGRGVIFATGTPISNSMAEMYTIQRYLDMDALKTLDIHNFDAWAATFGEIVPELEVTPTGAGFRIHSRFRNFVNMDQLSTLFRDVADVLVAEDLPNLPVPKVKDGKPKVVKADISEVQKAYVQSLEERMEKIRSGLVEPTEDNALVVTLDGTKAALDMRLISPGLPDNPKGKVNLMIDNALEVYKSTAKAKSTQLIFCDFSTPKKDIFNVYYDVRDKLIKAGVPKQEIAFIHDYPKDDQKLTLFQKVRQGDIRILMGSTKKMGEGMNVQNRVVAVHHLDAPWTPASVEQRDGRAIRPGNENEEVTLYRYVTQSTFDAYRWQILENKAKFINQAMKGGLDTVEDIGRTVIDYATAKAIAADNPIVMEKVKVENDLRKYQAMHQGWRDQRYKTQQDIAEAKNYLHMYEGNVAAVEADLKTRQPKPEDKDFSIRFHAIPGLGIKDATITDKKEAGKELVKAYGTRFEDQIKAKVGALPLFSYRGFKFNINQSEWVEEKEKEIHIILEAGKSLMRVWPKLPTLYLNEESAASTYVQEINKVIDKLDQDLLATKHQFETYGKKSNALTKWLKENPEFEHIDKLKELKARADGINAQLRETNKPVEKAPEETPGQYYIARATDTGTEYIPVKGKKIEILPWIETFIRKDEKSDAWVIGEATTGLAIGSGRTQKDAQDNAFAALNRQGQEQTKESIAAHIKEQGASPWVPEGETRLAMAGKKAIGAPTGALAKAQKMLAKGTDEKIVWVATGWMKGPEGKWRFEIDDSGAKLKKAAPESSQYGDLPDFLEHGNIYKAYPQLKKIFTQIIIDPKAKTETGSFRAFVDRSGEGLTDLSPEIHVTAPTLDSAKAALLHEVQHAIQEIEGFARGGSPELMALELVNKETRYLEKTNKTYRDLSQKIITLYFDGYRSDSGVVKMRRRQQQKIFDEHVTKKYGAEHPSLALYKRLAGEIEAREVVIRQGLIPEQRRGIPPYSFLPIERKDWVIIEGKGTSFSVDPSLVAEPTGYKFTKRQQKNLIEIGTLIPGWLKRAGADEKVLKNITLELKPFIDLRGKNVDKTLKDWEKEGIDASTILGATTFENYHALIQLAINGQTLGKLEKATYHEWYHVAKAWMLPRSDIEALGKHFKTEESEANAFAEYMKDAKAIDPAPGFIKRLFLKLKRMINIIRNGLKGKGFNRPEDVFGSIRVGAYKPVRMETRKEVKTFLARAPGFFKAVAVRTKAGKVYKGKPGEIHVDVLLRIPIGEKAGFDMYGRDYENAGFIDQKGKFYTRAEASIAVGEYEARAMGAKGLMPETRLAMEKKPPTISKEEKAAEEYVQEALGKVRETKVTELRPEKLTAKAERKIINEEAKRSLDDLIAQAKDDERLVHHVRSTLKKAMSIGKKTGIAIQKAHYQVVVARAKARKEQIAKIRKMIAQLKALDIEKLSPQEKQPVGDLLAGINLVKPSKRVVARLTNARRYLEDNPDAELPEYVMENLKRLDKKNIRDMSIEEIESLHTAVMHYVHLNKLKGIIKVRRERRRKAEVLSSSIGEMKEPKKVKSEIVSSQKSKLGRAKKTAKLITDTFGIRHDHYDLVIESLSGVNSTMDKVLYQDVKDGIIEQLKYKQETYADFLEDVGDVSTKYGISDISNWLNEQVTTGKFRFTRGERMALLRHALNRDNLRHLLAGGFGFRTSETPNKRYMISAKELNQVLQSLTPAEKHFAGTAVNNLFEGQYKALNKVFYAKNNYELPKTRDPYYPIEVMSITLGKDLESVEALEKFKGRWTRIGLEKGMLEKRVKSKKPIYLNSIVFDINRSVMKSAAYVGLEIPLSNASKLLYDRTFRAELESRYGKQTWREIEKGLRDIAGDYQSYTTVEEMVLKLKNNLSVAMLGVNPFVMAKQILSLPIYLTYVKTEYLLQGMIDFTVHPIEIGERHKMYSPEYLERVEGGYSRDVADVFKSAAMKRLYAGKTTIKEKFMGGIQLFDRVAVSAGMQGAVLQVLDEFDQGKLSREVKLALDLEDADIAKLTPEKKMALAYKFADYATERTQPMFSPEHRSSLSRGTTIEKLATMFGAFTNTALRLMRGTYREARRTGEPAAYVKLGKVLFLILVVNTLGVMAIDEIRDRITKKKKRPSIVGRILNTWAGYMFFVRDLANSVISKIERGTFAGYDVQLPIQRVPELLSNVLANAVKAFSDETPAKRKKATARFIDDGLNLLLMTQGIPYQTPKRMVAGTITKEESPKY